MKIFCAILISLLAINGLCCKHRITSDERPGIKIDDLPILACMNDRDGEVEFRLNFRATGRFERLSGVAISIENGTTSQELFYGYLALLDIAKKDGVKTVVFYLPKDLIPNATLEVSSPVMTTNGLHGVSYVLPVCLIHEFFKDNITSGLPAGSTVDSSSALLDEFLGKTFTADETNNPNQQVDPIVTTPVDKVEAQSTQGHP